MISAVLFDLGGVIVASPFDAFSRYEAQQGLPAGFIRTLNSTNPDDNAWARLERGEIGFDDFCPLFEAEARRAGGELRAADIFGLLSGDVREEMMTAVRRCRKRVKTGLLTNNFHTSDAPGPGSSRHLDTLVDEFDVVIESSKTGIRKPDPRFYKLACGALGISPHQAVFLDDLGVNLKPARAMGMTTIKVGDPDEALRELERVVGFPVR